MSALCVSGCLAYSAPVCPVCQLPAQPLHVSKLFLSKSHQRLLRALSLLLLLCKCLLPLLAPSLPFSSRVGVELRWPCNSSKTPDILCTTKVRYGLQHSKFVSAILYVQSFVSLTLLLFWVGCLLISNSQLNRVNFQSPHPSFRLNELDMFLPWVLCSFSGLVTSVQPCPSVLSSSWFEGCVDGMRCRATTSGPNQRC